MFKVLGISPHDKNMNQVKSYPLNSDHRGSTDNSNQLITCYLMGRFMGVNRT